MNFGNFSKVVFVLLLVLVPIRTKAAVLYLESPETQYSLEETFALEVKVNPEEESINAIRVALEFDSDILEVIGFDFEYSILSFWIEQPTLSDIKEINSTGFISFTGGIPNGYKGKFIGTPLEANSLGKIIFKPKSFVLDGGQTIIKLLDNSLVLLNNGRGSVADLTVETLALNISNTGVAVDLNEKIAMMSLPTFSRYLFLLENL